MSYNVNPLFRSGYRPSFATMGDASGDVRADTTHILNIGEDLRNAQKDLDALVQAIRSSPALSQAISRDAVQQQQDLNSLKSKYSFVYRAVFGQMPPGLGEFGMMSAAGVILLAYIGANLYLWWVKQKTLDDQAKVKILEETNRAALIAQAQQLEAQSQRKAAAGDAAGAADDHAAAQASFSQAGVPGGTAQPGGKQDWGAFLQENWLPIGLLIGAIVIVPKFLD